MEGSARSPQQVKSQGQSSKTCPERGELSTSNILCFQPSFYPRDGEQMTGTGVPGCAEGAPYTCFLSQHARTRQPLRYPWRFPLLMQTGRALSLSVPTTSPFIKFYKKSQAVNQFCENRRRRRKGETFKEVL